MCTLTPVPHLLVLTAPWDAPLQWALLAGSVLVLAGLYALAVVAHMVRSRRAARITGRPARIPSVIVAALALFGIAGMLLLCASAVLLLVLWPAHDRLDAWYASERARLLAFNCDPSAFIRAYGMASQTLNTWDLITILAQVITVPVAIAGGILTIIGATIQPARTEASRSPT